MKNKIKLLATLFALAAVSTVNAQTSNVLTPDPFGGQTLNTLTMWTDVTSGSLQINNSLVTQDAININVNSRDLNLFTLNRSYNIGNQRVLWHGGIGTNIFVGVGAGLNSPVGFNTFVGNNAGLNCAAPANTMVGYNAGSAPGNIGNVNTFIGSQTGASNTNGKYNTFVGGNAGISNLGGERNTFTGFLSGYNNTEGDWNSFYGSQSGVGNVTGEFNSFFGSATGSSCNNCHDNTFAGYGSGVSATGANTMYNSFYGEYSGGNMVNGDKNTFIGYLADVPLGSPAITNATALGANAVVRNSDKMILGDNNVNVGIGLSNDMAFGGPLDKLEIESGSSCISGLKFRSLNSLCPPTGINTNFLTVDPNGRVVLESVTPSTVSTANAVSLYGGSVVWGGPNPLIYDTEIPMTPGGDFSIYFTGQTSMPSLGSNPVDIGIGHPMGNPLVAKLDVINNTFSGADFNFTNEFAGKFHQTGSYTSAFMSFDNLTGVRGECDVTHGYDEGLNLGGDFYAKNALSFNIGARGTADQNVGRNIGLWGYAANDMNGIGVKGVGQQTRMSTGVEGTAFGGVTWNHGVYGTAIPQANSTGVGVYGFINLSVVPPPGSVNYAVFGDLLNPGPTIPHFAGYFNGDIGTTTVFYAVSDLSLKENVKDLQNPLDIIKNLNPKSYTFKKEEYPSMTLASGTHYGLISQEVESVLPTMVKDCVHPARYDEEGKMTAEAVNYKSLSYIELIPFLIGGMKEQQSQIETQQKQIDALTLQMKELQSSINHGEERSGAIGVTLNNANAIILNQNVPNPFAERTTIEYFIPDNVSSAQIIFYDNEGTVMKEVEINGKGKGQLNVFAADLSSGVYTYSLIADGNLIETKHMVCSK